jgi:hypothetical protein
MSNTIEPGTIACVPGTLSGSIFLVLNGLVAPADQPLVETAFKRVAFGVASGLVSNIVASIDDTKYLQVNGGEIIGGDGGEGGGAPDAHAASHLSNGADPIAAATTTIRGTVELATNGQTDAGVVVQGNDSRLSDDRDPNDHATSHQNAGGDEIDVTGLSGLLADGQNPLTHAESHENAGDDPINVTGLVGLLATAQTPATHAASHKSLGADPIRIDELKIATDVTTLNSTTTEHGLLRKLSGQVGEYMSGTGVWLNPAEYPVTAYELDWTAQATQLGLASGTVVVDGINWTAANAADASLFRIQNGSGLQITATAGVSKTWTGATLTSPSMRVQFEDLAAAAAKYQLTLTVWSYFSAWSLPQSSNSILVGCYAPAGAVYTTVVSGVGFNNNGVNNFPYLQRSATFTPATALGPAYDVLVWRFLPGGTVDGWCGVWAAGWPTALTPIGNDVQPSAATIVTTALIRRAGATLIYSPMTRSASGAPSFTLARTKVQVG